MLRLPFRYKNGQPPVEVLWRTLIAGRTDTAFPAPPETAQQFSEYITTAMLGYVLKHAESKDDEAFAILLNILVKIEKYCPHPTIPSPQEFTSMFSATSRDLGGLLQASEKSWSKESMERWTHPNNLLRLDVDGKSSSRSYPEYTLGLQRILELIVNLL